MIDSGKEIPIPSKLREAQSRHDTIAGRISIFKENAQKLGIHAPAEYSNDEHYWFTAMNREHVVSSFLRDSIKDKDQLRIASLNIAMNEAQELLRLEKLKSTDTLTGAWSRGALDNFLENLRAKPKDTKTTGFLLLDCDDFKNVNDTLGHTSGDTVLKKLTYELVKKTRGMDMVARYGGEEFAVVLPNIPVDIALKVVSRRAEAIRKAIEIDKIGITVSIGATVLRNHDDAISDIYNRADKYLYQAKRNGKNKVFNDDGLVKNT